jgi:hypothetical protein
VQQKSPDHLPIDTHSIYHHNTNKYIDIVINHDDNDVLNKTCYENGDIDHEDKIHDILDYNKHVNDDIILFIDMINQDNDDDDDILFHGNKNLSNTTTNNNNHIRNDVIDRISSGLENDDDGGGDHDRGGDDISEMVTTSKFGTNNDNVGINDNASTNVYSSGY